MVSVNEVSSTVTFTALETEATMLCLFFEYKMDLMLMTKVSLLCVSVEIL